MTHFRLDAAPSVGLELQSEYMVARRDAVAALGAVRELALLLQPLLLISEVRSMTGDDLWMSMAHGRDTIGIHFTWKADEAAVRNLLPDLEAALAPFAARPHWGKIFLATASELSGRYERLADFVRLAERLDPRGAFRNAFIERHVAPR